MSHDEDTVRSFAKEVLRLGHECRDLSAENARLRTKVDRLTDIIIYCVGAVAGYVLGYFVF